MCVGGVVEVGLGGGVNVVECGGESSHSVANLPEPVIF